MENPVCGEEMCSETVLKHTAGYRAKIGACRDMIRKGEKIHGLVNAYHGRYLAEGQKNTAGSSLLTSEGCRPAVFFINYSQKTPASAGGGMNAAINVC